MDAGRHDLEPSGQSSGPESPLGTPEPTAGPADPALLHISSDAIRTPRSAAIAGIVFSVLLSLTIVLVRRAVPADPAAAGDWLTDPSKRRSVRIALNILPFAGIAFLWFIAVVRSRIGAREDRFFATVFLGSGLLFIAMLFGAAAMATGLMLSVNDGLGAPAQGGVWSFGRRSTTTLLTVYAMRMAAVFSITTTTLLARLRLVPRWLVVLGYLTGAVLLLTSDLVPWVELIFPAWTAVLSIYIFVAAPPTATPAATNPPR